MCISDLIERYSSEYETVRDELETAVANGASLLLSDVLGVSFVASEQTRADWRSIGMSERDIDDFELKLRLLEGKLHPRTNCLSADEIMDYVEDNISELDAKKYYCHFKYCPDCRKQLFLAYWLMRD